MPRSFLCSLCSPYLAFGIYSIRSQGELYIVMTFIQKNHTQWMSLYSFMVLENLNSMWV